MLKADQVDVGKLFGAVMNLRKRVEALEGAEATVDQRETAGAIPETGKALSVEPCGDRAEEKEEKPCPAMLPGV